jgi:hypothetical protein
METSFFMDKTKQPTDNDLLDCLKSSYNFWVQIKDYVIEKYPDGKAEWNYPGKNYGWSYRIKDKKRAIIYFLPRDKYFKVAFVFGNKATQEVLSSCVCDEIKKELESTKPYIEGRGIRIDIVDNSKIKDIKELIQIKMAN